MGSTHLYDVRSEIEKAKVAMGAEPKSPELDAAIERYIAAYQTLAPIITQAYGYYERQDYKADKMVEGKPCTRSSCPPARPSFRSARSSMP